MTAVPEYGTSHIIKYADDLTVVGLIADNDKDNCRRELSQLAQCCNDNGDERVCCRFQEKPPQHSPLTSYAAVGEASCTKFLEMHISEDLSWTINTISLS